MTSHKSTSSKVRAVHQNDPYTGTGTVQHTLLSCMLAVSQQQLTHSSWQMYLLRLIRISLFRLMFFYIVI